MKWRIIFRMRRLAAAIISIVLLGAVTVYLWRQPTPAELLVQGRLALEQGDTQQLETILAQLEKAGHTDYYRLLRGEWLWSRGDVHSALALVLNVSQQGPLRTQATLLTARCLLALEQYQEAYKLLAQVLQEDELQVDAHRGLAALTYDLGQWQQAEYHLRQVAALDSQDARPLRLLGLMYKDLARWEEAESVLRAGLQRSPPEPLLTNIHLDLAEVLIRRSQFEEALRLLASRQPSHDSEGNRNWHYLRAEAFYGLGRIAEAVHELETVPREQWSASMWRCAGRAHRDRDHLHEATKCLEKAVQLDRSDAESWHLLAQIYDAFGQKQAAAEARRQTEQLHSHLERLTTLTQQAIQKPWDPQVRQELAAIHEQLGQTALARQWRQAAAVCAAARPQ